MSNRFFLKIVLAIVCVNVYAQISNEDKAEIAGRYWGAVIMADEFKKTNCGKSISIDKKWTDSNAAKLEILSSFPSSAHAELNQFFTRQRENSMRVETYGMWSKVPSDKCEGARNLFWKLFDDSVTKWKSVK